jgi:GTP-binding protein
MARSTRRGAGVVSDALDAIDDLLGSRSRALRSSALVAVQGNSLCSSIALCAVKAGDGGSGIVSFRREKFVPMGGPTAARAARRRHHRRRRHNLSTLLDYTTAIMVGAERRPWIGSNKTAVGGDVVLPVPVGTIIRDLETSELIGEISRTATRSSSPRRPGREGQQLFRHRDPSVAARVSSRAKTARAAPRARAQAHRRRRARRQPNAGKSTLLSVDLARASQDRDYPFTTLSPNLGVVQLSDSRTFVVADIPGIIEGRTRAGSACSFCGTSSARGFSRF